MREIGAGAREIARKTGEKPTEVQETTPKTYHSLWIMVAACAAKRWICVENCRFCRKIAALPVDNLVDNVDTCPFFRFLGMYKMIFSEESDAKFAQKRETMVEAGRGICYTNATARKGSPSRANGASPMKRSDFLWQRF